MNKLNKLLKFTCFLFLGLSSIYSADFGSNKESIYGLDDQKMLQILSIQEYSTLEWQKNMLKHMNKVLEKEDGKIYARDLLKLHKLVIKFYSKIKKPSEEIIEGLPNMINDQDLIVIDNTKESFINRDSSRYVPLLRTLGRSKRSNNRRLRAIKNTDYHINPTDDLGQELLSQFKIQFVVRLILLDNFYYGIAPFMLSPKLRRSIITQLPDHMKEEKLSIIESWKSYMKEIYKTEILVKGYKAFVEGNVTSPLVSTVRKNEFEKAIDHIIKNSWSFSKLKKKDEEITFFSDMMENINYMTMRRRDSYNSSASVTVNALSMAFGNTAGLFQSRKGKLYNMSKDEISGLMAELKPLDVVFEKTPFRLTDKFIPGHFGHAAVWVGNEEQLKELGVWNELPRLYKIAVEQRNYQGPSFQEAVRSGHRIIEALRPGVQFNTLKHFLDIDDLAVSRMKNCADGEDVPRNSLNDITCLNNKLKKEYLLKSFEQVGKDYDFNFDVNTIDKIVCSELLYRTFIDVNFETTLTIGRHNISPDQVAKKVVGDEPIYDPVLLYFNGTRVNKAPEVLRDIFKNLLDADYKSVEETSGVCADYSGDSCQ